MSLNKGIIAKDTRDINYRPYGYQGLNTYV